MVYNKCFNSSRTIKSLKLDCLRVEQLSRSEYQDFLGDFTSSNTDNEFFLFPYLNVDFISWVFLQRRCNQFDMSTVYRLQVKDLRINVTVHQAASYIFGLSFWKRLYFYPHWNINSTSRSPSTSRIIFGAICQKPKNINREILWDLCT